MLIAMLHCTGLLFVWLYQTGEVIYPYMRFIWIDIDPYLPFLNVLWITDLTVLFCQQRAGFREKNSVLPNLCVNSYFPHVHFSSPQVPWWQLMSYTTVIHLFKWKHSEYGENG